MRKSWRWLADVSNAVTDKCRPLRMPPTPKAVLMSLADYANDAGECWPSIPTLCDWTCFSERAVHNAIKWLEQAKLVIADRSDGRHTRYVVTADGFQPPQELRHRRSCATAAGAVEPPQEMQSPPQHVQSPPQELRSNHQEPLRTTKKATTKSAPVLAVMPDGVDPQTWADWLALRKAKKAPVSETVLREVVREAAKAGLTLTRFLEIWCARGSQGLQADWLKPNERAGPASSTRPSASADFRGKTYAGTPIDQLPPDLRDAARAAIAGD